MRQYVFGNLDGEKSARGVGICVHFPFELSFFDWQLEDKMKNMLLSLTCLTT